MNKNEIGKIVVYSAVCLHKKLDPGLLESVYEVLLSYELQSRGLKLKRHVSIPIEYRGMKFDKYLRGFVREINEISRKRVFDPPTL